MGDGMRKRTSNKTTHDIKFGQFLVRCSKEINLTAMVHHASLPGPSSFLFSISHHPITEYNCLSIAVSVFFLLSVALPDFLVL